MAEENETTLRGVLQQMLGNGRIHRDLLADDAEWVNPADAVEPGTRRGADSFNAAIAGVFAAWDEVHFETERVIESGDEVVVLGVMHGRLHTAGMALDSPHGQIWTFRDGKVARMCWFNTHRETLDAAGLSE